MSRSPWDHEPVNDRRIGLLMPASATTHHDGGALFPDGPGDHTSGHATAYVSRHAVPAFRTKGQPAAPLVIRARAARTGFRALAADCRYNPSGSPHFIAELDRAATPCLVAVEPNTPLMTETG